MLFSCCDLGKCDVGRWSRGIEGKATGFLRWLEGLYWGM